VQSPGNACAGLGDFLTILTMLTKHRLAAGPAPMSISKKRTVEYRAIRLLAMLLPVRHYTTRTRFPEIVGSEINPDVAKAHIAPGESWWD
jgi:hypothetical protein